MNQSEYLDKIVAMAIEDIEIASVWLYGSRARNAFTEESDYDVAVLYSQHIKDPFERRLRPELLSRAWSRASEQEINVIDISLAPLPLAMTVLNDDRLLYDAAPGQRLKLEQGLMSKWELDYLYSESHYA